MRNRKWLFVCAAALFSFTVYTQSTFADSQESRDSPDQTMQTAGSSSIQGSDKPIDTSTGNFSKELTSTEEKQQIKQTIYIQKVISSEQLDNQGNQLKKQDGVNGAKFVIYDVTEIFQKMTQEGKLKNQPLGKATTLVKERVEKLAPDQLKKMTEGETKTREGKNGVFAFRVSVSENQKQALYIVNPVSPTNVANSEAILLILPVSNGQGELMKDSWIYPKSQVSTPKIEKKKIVSTGVKHDFWFTIIQTFKGWWNE